MYRLSTFPRLFLSCLCLPALLCRPVSAFKWTYAKPGAVDNLQQFMLPVTAGTCGSGSLLGFAKCLRDVKSGRLHWRVVAGFLPSTPLQNSEKGVHHHMKHLGQFYMSDCESPSLFIKDQLGNTHQLTKASGPPLAVLSWEVFTQYQNSTTTYRLKVGASQFSMPLHAQCSVPEVDPWVMQLSFPVNNWVLLAVPPLHIDVELYGNVLVTAVKWHVKLGFTGYLVYVRPHQLHAILAHKEVNDLVTNHGTLKFIMWDATPEMRGFPWAFQTLFIGHAFLAAWGRDVAFLTVDLDEHLVLPTDYSLRNVWENQGGRRTVFSFRSMGVMCSSCTSPELQRQVWTHKQESLHPLSLYDVVVMNATMFTALNHIKTWSNVNCAWPVSVHAVGVGSNCKEHGDWWSINMECGFLYHMYNLWSVRQSTIQGHELCRVDAGSLKLAPHKGSDGVCSGFCKNYQ